RVEKLEKEAKSGACKSEEINSKWALAKEMRIPEELWELLNQQQQRCAELLEEKNKLIRDLQQVGNPRILQHEHQLWVEGTRPKLVPQWDKVRCSFSPCSRPGPITCSYGQPTSPSLPQEWPRVIWEVSMGGWGLEIRISRIQGSVWPLLAAQFGFGGFLVLFFECQTLEKQLQQMKAVYQLTQEKLEYNLEVLKKQDEENTIIRSQQKRKINRLHSLLSNLKTRLGNQKKQCREDNQSLAADCERIWEQCREVQRKMRHFALSDAKKFREVWLMNEEEAKKLMGKALAADHIIHTQQLGLPWVQPHYWFLTNVGPLGHGKAKLAVESLAEEEKEAAGTGEGGKAKAGLVEDGAKTQQDISKTIKRILELVTAESTLEIDDEDDQYELVDFFLKYKAQEVALGQVGPSGTVVGRTQQGSGGGGAEHLPSTQTRQRGDLGCRPQIGGEDLTYPAGDREDDGFGGHRVELKGSQSSQGSLPAVAIQPDDVLKILKVFVQDFSKLRLKDGAGKEMLQVRDSSRDGEYWESLAQVIPEATLKLWDALAVALEEYYKVLTCRANLLAEVATLDQQNTELCLLLEEYLNSGVNSFLLCPPMQSMDLDLSCP
ncbi:DRC1 protein, partial [Oreotrochilus melanogaster]|nr:DRC1 protein [Oreotrochilus melanogaster]